MMIIKDELTTKFNNIVKDIDVSDLINVSFDNENVFVIDLEDEETNSFQYIQIGAEIAIKMNQLNCNVYQLQYNDVEILFCIFARNEDELMKIITNMRKECTYEESTNSEVLQEQDLPKLD